MTDQATASILVSVSARTRLAVAGSRLREFLQGGDEVLLLAPSRGAADDLLRRLSGTGGGVLGVHAMSFGQWTLQAAALDLAARGLRPITPLGTEAIAARAARLAEADGELERLSPVAGMPGFARSLAATIGELRAAGVPPSTLTGNDGTRDLGRLLQRFADEMQRFGLADRPAVLRLAAEALAQGRASVPRCSIWLDLPLRSRAQADVLRSLAGRSLEVLATSAAGDQESLEWLTSVLGDGTVTDLERQTEGDGHGALSRVQRFVFETGADAAGRPPATETTTSVDLFSAAGEGQECVEIARRIRAAAADGLPFDRIAILARQPTAYLPLIEDALGRAGIPTYVTRGSLRPNPAGRAFLALLACAGERLSASRFAEYLSLGQTPRPAADGAPPKVEAVPWVEPAGEQLVLKSAEPPDAAPKSPESAAADVETEEADDSREDAAPAGALRAPAQWERLLVDAAVVGGADRWRKRLEGLDAEFRLQLREAADENEGRRGYLERQIARLGTLRSFALPLVEFLDDLPESADWGRVARPSRPAGDDVAAAPGVRARSPGGAAAALGDRRGRPLRGRAGARRAAQIQPPRTPEAPLRTRLRRRSGGGGRSLLRSRLRAGAGRRGLSAALGRGRPAARRAAPRSGRGGLPPRRRRRPHASRAAPLAARGRCGGPGGSTLPTRGSTWCRAGPACRRSTPWTCCAPRKAGCRTSTRWAGGPRPPAPPSSAGRPPPTRTRRSTRRSSISPCSSRCSEAPCLRRNGRAGARFPAVFQRASGPGACGARAGRWRPRLVPGRRARRRRRRGQGVPGRGTVSAPRSYSPTALQNFAACPYRFFLQAVLYLRPRDELVQLEQLDPMTRGGIFHEIQFRLFGVLREAQLLPVTDARLDEVFRVLDVVLEGAERDYRDRLAPPIERVWSAEFEGLRGDLRGWLRQVADEGGGWTPVHAELGFGLSRSGERDPKSVPEPAEVQGGARLRGSIDLVEADAAGRLRVTDHKTGGARHAGTGLVIGGGKVLQPVLYSLAAEAVLEREVVSGRLSYCTQRGGYRVVSVPLDERSRAAARRMLDTVDGALEQGFLPAAPGKDECRYCDYRPVCGPYEDLRVARKQRRRLEPLHELRLEP